MRKLIAVLAANLVMLGGCRPKEAPVASNSAEAVRGESTESPSIGAIEVVKMDGSRERLSAYQGKVLLVVNVASQCGLTPQYQGLEELFRARASAGFMVLAFPANDFGNQEPGSDAEIEAFCSQNYGVTFPVFSKISVVGEGAHPLYKELAKVGGEPNWNFTKYLVDRQGRVVRRFDPRTKPDDPDLVSRIEALLGG